MRFHSLLFLVFLSLLSLSQLPALAQSITPLDAQSMEARVLIANTVRLDPEGPRYSVGELQGTLSWFPREYYLQEVSSLTTEPSSDRDQDTIEFYWEYPGLSEEILLQSTIKTKNAIMPVRERMPFPLSDIPPDIAVYLSDGEIIDQSPEIKELAQQLATGKNDQYEVVFSLADWITTNVNYSLASLGAVASQKSSEVLKSRYGKCDELTSLFISMNRALGIPARFAAGYSYTNSEQYRKGWGGHGWAEVWYPGYGWIPYDVTYGEYGYLDAGHVLLKIAPDAKENSIDYSARGNDFELETEQLKVTITPTMLIEKTNPEISLSLDAPVRRVGFGSSVLVLATVRNERDYYVSTRLDIAKTTNTEMLSDDYQNVLLRPKEVKIVPFLLKIDDDLREGYTYEFPFRVISRIGESAVVTVDVDEQAPYYDPTAFSEELLRYAQKGTVSHTFSVTCDQGEPAYPGSEIMHDCIVKGSSGITVCFAGKCEKQDLSEKGEFVLRTKKDSTGVFTETYLAKSGSDSLKFFVTSRTISKPEINIEIIAPSTVRVDDLITAIVNLKASGSKAKDVAVTLRVKHSTALESIPDLDRPARLNFALPGRALRPGANDVVVEVKYKDELGTEYAEDSSLQVTLTDVGIADKITFYLEDAGYWLAGLFE